MSSQPARPRQATVAASLIMGGSLFVVLTVFERVAGLTSLETRKAVEDFLSQPPGDGLGLGTEEVLDLLRVLAMVAGGCAAAAAILGYQVLKRSRSARLVLSVLAVPLFLTGLAAGGFMSSVVAASVVMLWMQPTRAWFDGTTPPERPARRAARGRDDRRATGTPSTSQTPPPVPPEPESSDPAEPRAWPGFGTPAPGAVPTAHDASDHPSTGSAPGSSPVAVAPGGPGGPGASAAAAQRPAGLVWACALTWAATGLAAAGALMGVLVMLAAPEFVLDQLRETPDLAEAGLSDDAVRTAVLVTGAVVVLWCLAAAVLAGLAWRGVGWARVALVVSAALAAVLSVVSVVTNPLMILPLAAAVATVVLLNRPDVRAFCTRR